MTSLRKMVLQIPEKYRRQLLEQNIIYRAQVSAQDKAMQVLHTIWTTFIDPDGENAIECPFCLQNILNNFRGLEAELLALAKEENLLEGL